MPHNDAINFDKEHIWHPYTSIDNPQQVYHIASASGVKLKLSTGESLIDGMSSWWTAIHGYNHPVLNKAAKEQLQLVSHVMFGGLTHDPAVELASLLVAITPGPLQKVFFSDSGSVAVEVAMKMAIQFWNSSGKKDKNKFLTIRSGYHGDTFNAMSVCDPVTGMHELFTGVLPKNYFADAPKTKFNDNWDENDINSFKNLIDKHHNEIAAVILEPIVQGAGGMKFYSPEYLCHVKSLCDEYNVLLIFDEIATGFGRTGKMFACEHADICPDIMCIGKALTGGYVTLAATLTTGEVANTISSGNPGLFMHGPTYMANPLACKIASASINLLLSMPLEKIIKNIESQIEDELSQCKKLKCVKDVRTLGAIGVVELKNPVEMESIVKQFVSKGVWIRPFGKLVYIMPPYIIDKTDLSKLNNAIVEVINDID